MKQVGEGGAATQKETRVTIKAPDLRIAEFEITGTAPYVQNRFSAKAKQQIHDTQAQGTAKASGRKIREPKDFDALCDGAIHYSEQGWAGIPAASFRCAMISACRLVGFQMTKAKLSAFVLGEGFDKVDGVPLVKIVGKHEKTEMHVRNDSGVVDLRARPMWRNWACRLKVQYDADQFTETDLANLLMRAGLQVGVGEGRPDSKNSAGMGWGTFKIN